MSIEPLVTERLPELVQFLKTREIDLSFNLPLSLRQKSIESRVFDPNYCWLVLSDENDSIKGCRGVLKEKINNQHTFTTLVIHPDFRGLGFGKLLFKKSIELAIEMDHEVLTFDSPEESVLLGRLATKFGFKIDLKESNSHKRPEGMVNIHYSKKIKNLI